MSNKQVSITLNPRNKPEPDVSALDAFVRNGAPADPVAPEPKEPMKRLTFDIGASLHKRIRLACLEKDVDMAVELRRILMEHFPPAQ